MIEIFRPPPAPSKSCPKCGGSNTTWLGGTVSEFARTCRDCMLTFDNHNPYTHEEVEWLLANSPDRKFWVDGEVLEQGREKWRARIQELMSQETRDANQSEQNPTPPTPPTIPPLSD